MRGWSWGSISLFTNNSMRVEDEMSWCNCVLESYNLCDPLLLPEHSFTLSKPSAVIVTGSLNQYSLLGMPICIPNVLGFFCVARTQNLWLSYFLWVSFLTMVIIIITQLVLCWKNIGSKHQSRVVVIWCTLLYHFQIFSELNSEHMLLFCFV